MTETHAEPVHAVKVDGVWSTSIDYHISLEPLGRRVRGYLNGVPVVDSLNARVMLEKGHLPVYYFPRADVAADCLTPTDHRTHFASGALPSRSRARRGPGTERGGAGASLRGEIVSAAGFRDPAARRYRGSVGGAALVSLPVAAGSTRRR